MVQALGEGGAPVGILPRAEYDSIQIQLHLGDRLVLYSDGVIEAANAAGEEFGEHRLIAAVESDPQAEPGEISNRILRSVREFTGTDLLADDQTLLAIQYVGITVARETRAA